MIKTDVRSAVSVAQNYFHSIQDLLGTPLEDLRLEEVELSEDKKFWLITLGFSRPMDKSQNPLGDLVAFPKHERDYKIFKVDVETGDVQSMKIREL